MVNSDFFSSNFRSRLMAPRGKPTTLALAAMVGALAAYIPGEISQAVLERADLRNSFSQLIVVTSIWTMINAVGYSLAMTIGQNIYLRRPWLNPRESAGAIAGGAAAGLVSGGLAQAFFSIAVTLTAVSGLDSTVLIEMARIAAWAMLGSLIGLGMSFFIPNLGRFYGLAGGALGGAVGAVGFILATALSGDMVGRLIGMTMVGGALGAAIGLVEEVSRSAWLKVSFGNVGESRIVSLGNEPVCIGSDSRRCAVWAQGAPPVALRFSFANGQVTYHDIPTEHRMIVPPGFQHQVGRVTVTVCVDKTSSSSPPPTSLASLPPPPPPPSVRPTGSVATPGFNPSGLGRSTPIPARPATSPRGPGATPPPPPPPPPPRR